MKEQEWLLNWLEKFEGDLYPEEREALKAINRLKGIVNKYFEEKIK